MTRGAVSLLALLAVVLAPAAAAFESLPGGPHDSITAAAAREAGVPDAAVGALVEAVRAVDYRDSVLEPKVDDVDRIDAAGGYRPERHCDRRPPAGDAESFNATAAYVADRSDAAVAALRANDTRLGIRHLGEMLHALQDCLSHSNAVDLGEPEAVVHAVNGHAEAPEGLRLTGFLPGSDDPERPPGDPYPHADFAKDSGDKNDESGLALGDGRTKFEAARDLAIAASILALQDVLAQLDPWHLEALAAARDGGQPIPRVGVPGPAWSLLALAVAGAAARRRSAGPFT